MPGSAHKLLEFSTGALHVCVYVCVGVWICECVCMCVSPFLKSCHISERNFGHSSPESLIDLSLHFAYFHLNLSKAQITTSTTLTLPPSLYIYIYIYNLYIWCIYFSLLFHILLVWGLFELLFYTLAEALLILDCSLRHL